MKTVMNPNKVLKQVAIYITYFPLRLSRFDVEPRRRCAPLFLIIAGLVAGCKTDAVTTREVQTTVPVTVAKALVQDVPVRLQAIGSVQTVSSVSIRALVGGELKSVGFHQGDRVHKGQVLFTIDSQPYESAFAQAQANLARDLANATRAKAQAKRYAELASQGVVSAEQNEQAQATAEANESVVRSDKAALDAAKLNLSYCTITSPIDGRTGSLLIQPGNLVQPNTTVLVVINQIAPIYVSFAVPEQFLQSLKALDSKSATVLATVQNDQSQGTPMVETGTLSFINNAIDISTGTIQLMATFPNTSERLWPSQFVNTEIVLSVLRGAVVVPTPAVLTGQNGMYVYIVMPDGTVQTRTIVSSVTTNGLSVVTSGLKSGETVVVDGQVALSPGAKVSIQKSRNTVKAI
jgi:membrane fusion protein, multidrug efflux system